jgi:hypothetical protein
VLALALVALLWVVVLLGAAVIRMFLDLVRRRLE